MIVGSKEMLNKAMEEKYAVPALNPENIEMLYAIIEASIELKSPLIIQNTTSTLKYISPSIFAGSAISIDGNSNIPVAIHLDHGTDFELCKRCIKAGYTSVMIDGSSYDINKNIQISKEVVEYAKEKNIQVECELGVIGGKEEGNDTLRSDIYTKPEDVKKFVEETNCDSLAIAIGTAHGFYKDEPKLEFKRLEEIRKITNIPLVLHGTSGVSDSDVKKAVSLGISKLNFATILRTTYTSAIKECLKDDKVYDPKEYNKFAQIKLKEKVKEIIKLCGSENKA